MKLTRSLSNPGRERVLPAALGLLGAAVFHLLAWDGPADFHRSIDFNATAFEDFTGPYWGMGQEIFAGGRPVPGFLYSPFFAVLLGVFDGATEAVSTWAWFVFQLAATIALVVLGALLARPGPRALAAYVFVAFTSVPLLHNYHWGQMSVPLTALVLGGFVAYGAGARRSAALLLALAAAVKFYPALFLVYFVLREDWRSALLGVAATVACLLAVPVAAIGWDATLAFYASIAGTVGEAEVSGGTFAAAPSRQYFAAAVTRLAGWSPAGAGYKVLQLAGLAWAAAILFLVWRTRRERDEDAGLAFVGLSLTLPFVVSPCWLHYFAFLPACQLWLFTRPLGRFLLARRALVTSSVAASSMLLLRAFESPLDYASQAWLLGASLLALAAFHLSVLDRADAA